MKVQDILHALESAAEDAGQDPEKLGVVEQSYHKFGRRFQDLPFLETIEFYLSQNQFRIKNAGHMTIRRPRILLGEYATKLYPSHHISGYLKHTDVVSISSHNVHVDRVDRVAFHPHTETAEHLLERLAAGFEPDFLFDMQACAWPVTMPRMEVLPFPTVAGLVHHWGVHYMDHVHDIYDLCIPLSQQHTQLMALRHGRSKLRDIPCGYSWGSFHDLAEPLPYDQRDIDVSVTFLHSEQDPMYGGYRNAVVSAAEAFQQKYAGRFQVVISNRLNKQEYWKLLGRSKVSLNVCGVNGPYNYRTFEILNSGAVLMQHTSTYAGVDTDMSAYFEPESEYIPFDLNNFEAALITLLEDPERAQGIAAAGQARIKRDYAYDVGIQTLCKTVDAFRDQTPDYQDRRLDPVALEHKRRLSHFYGHPPEKVFSVIHGMEQYCADAGVDMHSFGLAYIPRLFDTARTYAARNADFAGYLAGDLFEVYARSPQELLYFFFNNIAEPTVTDRFNYTLQLLKYAPVPESDLYTLLSDIDATTDLTDMTYICVRLFDMPSSYHWLEMYIFNIAYLLAGADREACLKVIQDFMVSALLCLWRNHRPLLPQWTERYVKVLEHYSIPIQLDGSLKVHCE